MQLKNKNLKPKELLQIVKHISFEVVIVKDKNFSCY